MWSLLQFSLPVDSDNRGFSHCAPTVAAASKWSGKSIAPNLHKEEEEEEEKEEKEEKEEMKEKEGEDDEEGEKEEISLKIKLNIYNLKP